MLKFNLKYIFDLRGVDKPFSFLRKQGFSHSVSQNMSAGNLKSLRVDQVERLCEILQCTPNDLLEWTPEHQHEIEKSHPLFKLKRSGDSDGIRKALKDFPIDKLNELERAIEALKKESSL